MYDPEAIEAMTSTEWARLADRLSEAEVRSALTYLSGYDPRGVTHALNFVKGGGTAALTRAAGLAGRPAPDHRDTDGETWRTDGTEAAEHPQGNSYPDGTPWCDPCGTHHRPASVTA